MDFDMDLHRNAALAFGPASLTAGAILPYEGRSLMMRSDGLPAAVLEAEQDGWVSPNNPISDGGSILGALELVPSWQTPEWAELGFPVIARGRHAIFPLAAAPLRPGDDPAGVGRLSSLSERLTMHCIHFYGGDFFHAESRLDTETGYGRRLVEAAPVLPDPSSLVWWGIGSLAAVLVRSVDQQRLLETLALHVIPKEWVAWSPSSGTKREASRARRMLREQSDADATWSWPLSTVAD